MDLNATHLALNGLNNGYERLAQNTKSINQSLINQNKVEQNQASNGTLNPPTANYSELNNPPQSSLADGLVGLVQNKTQMQSLLKIISIEKQLFDNDLGKVFDTKV